MRKSAFWFPTRSDTNQTVEQQKMARGLNFKKVEGLEYKRRENKGADQLCAYRKSDLHLCFRIFKSLISS